jgi:hypothetical protein
MAAGAFLGEGEAAVLNRQGRDRRPGAFIEGIVARCSKNNENSSRARKKAQANEQIFHRGFPAHFARPHQGAFARGYLPTSKRRNC